MPYKHIRTLRSIPLETVWKYTLLLLGDKFNNTKIAQEDYYWPAIWNFEIYFQLS